MGPSLTVEEPGVAVNTADAPWLVVGLGNPGSEYANTRHNIGFDVVAELARRAGVTLRMNKRARALTAETRLDGTRAVLAEPQTFMNLSGAAVASLAGFYRIPAERVVAIHDDLDLPLGGLRVKCGGGSGGHNGIKSMASSLGTPDFQRVRVGIGRPPGTMDPAVYVLRRFSNNERPDAELAVVTAADATESLLRNGLAATQNSFNT